MVRSATGRSKSKPAASENNSDSKERQLGLAKYQPGYFTKQTLVSLEVRTQHLWYRKHESAVRQIQEQIINQELCVQ